MIVCVIGPHSGTRFYELGVQKKRPLATHLLQAGVDITVIALWLGHESPSTTHVYVEADLKMKERALNQLQAPKNTPVRYRAPDRMLQFLQSL